MSERLFYGREQSGSVCLQLQSSYKGVRCLVLIIRKALWTVRAPLTGNELPVTGGVPREAGCHYQRGLQLRDRAGPSGLQDLSVAFSSQSLTLRERGSGRGGQGTSEENVENACPSLPWLSLAPVLANPRSLLSPGL